MSLTVSPELLANVLEDSFLNKKIINEKLRLCLNQIGSKDGLFYLLYCMLVNLTGLTSTKKMVVVT